MLNCDQYSKPACCSWLVVLGVVGEGGRVVGGVVLLVLKDRRLAL